MAEPLSAGITRDRAFELLNEHNKDPFHITHGETVEGTMRYFAREFDPENEEFWGIVGLLHDLDWEEHEDDPMNHTIYAAEILEGEGASPDLIRAIQTHTSDFNTSLPKPELQMEKILFACDELTGLIGAAVIMRPSKSVMDFTTKSLKKKFKDKRFAAGCSRDVITQGAEMLAGSSPSSSTVPSRPCSPSPPTATPFRLNSKTTTKGTGTFVVVFVCAGVRGGPGRCLGACICRW